MQAFTFWRIMVEVNEGTLLFIQAKMGPLLTYHHVATRHLSPKPIKHLIAHIRVDSKRPSLFAEVRIIQSNALDISQNIPKQMSPT